MKFDVCIIGSGAGGALAAYGLQNTLGNIAIIEKGDWAKRNQDPLFSLQHYYRDQGFIGGLGKGFIGIPTGEVVGGTTTINSGTCFETPESVIQEWKDQLHISIERSELEPHFETLKTLLSIHPVPEEKISIGNKLFRNGVEALGFTSPSPLNRDEKNCDGSGRCPFVCPNEAKQSTDVAILPLFLKKGGTLLTQTTVTHIQEEKNKVLLFCKDAQKKSLTVECKKLIISAGSLSTHILIRKNKLGTEWKKAGNGLTVHPAVKVLAQFKNPLYSSKGVPQAIGFKHPSFPYLSFEGVFTPPQLASLVLPLDGKSLDDWLLQYDHVASFGVLVKDRGRGTVRHYPGLGLFIHYPLHPKDFLDLVEGARFIGLAYLKAGAQKVVLPFSGSQNEFLDFNDLKEYDFGSLKPSQLYAMGFHPLGSCGIKRVVDENLKVYGSDRIFIADGSVVPSSLGVNPQITIMAFALRLANYLKRQLKSSDSDIRES